MHINDKNKRPCIRDDTSHHTEEDEKISVKIQDLPDTSRYWLCWMRRIPYTILGQNGYGEDEGNDHDATLVEGLVRKYSSLTDGYSLLNDDIVTINNYSPEKYENIWDYDVMLEECGVEGTTSNAMPDQSDNTQNITSAFNNDSSNIEVFANGGGGSSDNNFTSSNDNQWDTEEYTHDGADGTTAEDSAPPKKSSSPKYDSSRH